MWCARTSCCICMLGMSVGDEVRTLPCWHRFHTACVGQVTNSCTVCVHSQHGWSLMSFLFLYACVRSLAARAGALSRVSHSPTASRLIQAGSSGRVNQQLARAGHFALVEGG